MQSNHTLGNMLEEIVENTGESFFITDTDGVILYVNRAFEQLTGWKAQELLGKKPNVLKSGEHSKEFYAAMWEKLRAGERWSGRLVNRRKDGSLYNEEIRILPIKGPSGVIKYFLTLRHDITKELQLENQLNQSQKMESLGLLAGQVSHDFNNLLTVIIGSMELVSEDLKPGTVSHKLSTEILRSSKEYANLIKQLLVFTRRGDATPEPIRFNEAIDELKVLFDSLLGKGVKVRYELAPDLWQVKMDHDQLKQALMNLSVNARDAMGGKGTLTIATRNSAPGEIPPGFPERNYAVLEVADTGPGIPQEIQTRIFEPFFTTKPKGKGTGLGLSTVYGIVTQAKGRVSASNKQGGGAVFTVHIPAI